MTHGPGFVVPSWLEPWPKLKFPPTQAGIIPQVRDMMLRAALERLVQLYDAWGKPDEAAKWRKELEKAKE